MSEGIGTMKGRMEGEGERKGGREREGKRKFVFPSLKSINPANQRWLPDLMTHQTEIEVPRPSPLDRGVCRWYNCEDRAEMIRLCGFWRAQMRKLRPEDAG